MGQLLTAKVRIEQRASRRRRASARCWVVDDTASRYVRLIDVCVDGARVEMAMPPDVGEQVQMRFRLRSGEPQVHATGTVVWRAAGFRGRGGVIGVHFMQVDGVSTILGYVERAG